ncbi:MAG TPA: LPS-assembly protein LptD [Bauldia sp.]|nr:LPS-assembly protein LptD [Bauldia sp.]
MTLRRFVPRVLDRIGGSVVVLAAALALSGTLAYAQDFGLGSVTAAKPKAGEQMLVESDQLVYDYDNNTVSALGNVKIYYAGYTLEAEKVTYIKSNGKLIATGAVKLTDPTGVSAYAEDIDITDDFRDGFVQSLRVDTPDNTHFAAESAKRENGETTTFVNGVYTACEPCKDNPEKPPLWQVKAAKIIVDQKTKMIYFRDATFEFKGVPLAWIPYFSTADPSVKRKTGFLAPVFGYGDAVGWSVTTPYFIALAPNYDATVTPSYYSQQGFLGQVEWRQRTDNGQFTLQMAGISQDDPGAFLRYDDNGNIIGGSYAQRDFRGGVRTTGEFDINRWWSFGWDGTLTTDRTFTRNYGVLTNDKVATTSNVHLTGLRGKNYFDARIEYFQILADRPTEFEVIDGDPTVVFGLYDQDRQAVVHPVIDHNYIFGNPVLGGELSLNTNITSLSRNENDPFIVNGDTYYHGVAGTFTRVSSEIGWQKKMIGPVGTVLTPFASLRGDAFALDPSGAAAGLITPDSTPTRVMPAAGLELSWPVMATAGKSTHVFEPIAQLIVRPDEQDAGKLPNDDAQSLVFDDTNLFDRDKFSGYDRVEGGTRLNAGVQYTGTFDNGLVVSGLFGQSFALAGQNSFASPDLADVGAFSGLETDRSDYVGRVSLDAGNTRFTVRGRFDDADFTINAGQVEVSHNAGPLTAAANYLYVREIPEAGITEATSQITTSASLTFVENWRVFGSAIFDLDEAYMRKNTVGVAFDDSCLSLSLAYSEVRGTDIPDQTIMVRVLLRTLAEGSVNANISSASSAN